MDATEGLQLPIMADPIWRLIIALAAILLTPLVVRVFKIAVREGLDRLNPALRTRVQAIGVWLIWLLMILFALSQLYLEVTTLLFVIALIGLAAILAVRDFLPSLFMEQLLTSEMLFKIGDWVQVGDFFGRVAKIDLLSTVIVTPSNEQVVIPNSTFSKEVVVNLTSKEGHRITIPFTVSRKINLKGLEEELSRICDRVKGDLITSKKPEMRIGGLDRDSIGLNLHCWVMNPGKRDYVISELLKGIIEVINRMETEKV